METRKDPSPRKSVPIAPVNDEAVDREVEELFGGDRPAVETAPNLDDFIAKTSRSKIAIVVPMFGYWQDLPDNWLDEDVLESAAERMRSYAHSAYVIILAEPQRLPPWSAKVINSRFVAGNVRGVAMPNGSSYGDYVRKGMQVALDETDAQFVVFHNPWVVIQDHGIDSLIDRVNLPDNAPVICGYEMHGAMQMKTNEDAQKFLAHKTSVPDEEMTLSFNLVGLARWIAEMCPLNGEYATQEWMERDFFQEVASRGYTAVSSERVPIFTWEVPWRRYVPEDAYAQDKAAFLARWKFLPADVKSPYDKNPDGK